MNIKTKLIETPPLPSDFGYSRGFGNGYIGVPKAHPWFGKDWDQLGEIDVHGGVTWAQDRLPNTEPDGLWWIGFDVAHCGDNLINWDRARVEQEIESLKEQAINATTSTTTNR